MDFDLEAVRAVFRTEADEHLSAMELALVELESDPGKNESINTIFRGAHSIKGGAASLALVAPTDFAHSMESLLDRVRSSKLHVSSPLVSLLLKAVDRLRAVVAASLSGETGGEEETKALVAAMDAFTGDEPAEQGAPTTVEAGPAFRERRSDDRYYGGRRTLRVDVDKLDRMLNLVGELAVSRARTRQLIENDRGGSSVQVLESHTEADRLFLDLQELVMKARMVPVGPVLRPYFRTVRDLSQARGKSVALVIEGEDTELDTGVVEHLKDPLNHMVRNAIDHGFETPHERVAAGKPAMGTIRISARHESGRIVVDISDDGRGLNMRKIRAKAATMGVPDAEKLSDAELQRLIFEPGFSTADAVTDVSGRGVGMDVVRRNVDSLHGSIGIESHEGRGTTFSVRLPLTLAIINGFVVDVASETYVLPMDAVLECAQMPEGANLVDGQGVLTLRGETLPVVRLRHLFAIDAPAPAKEKIVIVRHERGRVGVCVDRLLGESQTVIKPLGRLFRKVSGVSGTAILGTGQVALILDLHDLLRDLREGL